MRASERLLNEAAWKQPPLRWSHGSQTDGRTYGRGWPGGRTPGPRPVIGATVRGTEGTGPGLRTDITLLPPAAAAVGAATAPVPNTHTGEWGWMGRGREGRKEGIAR